MKLQDIYNKMKEFTDKHPKIWNNPDDSWEEFYALQDDIFTENQTYFSWNVEDCFRIDRAFDTVLEYIKLTNEHLDDYYINYIANDTLIILVETSK